MDEQVASTVKEEKDEQPSRAEALYREAKTMSVQGRSLDALEKFEEALEIFEAADGNGSWRRDHCC